MRKRLVLALLLVVAAGWSCGCVCTKSAVEGIPVRRLPDEVLHCPPCPPAGFSQQAESTKEITRTKSENKEAKPISPVTNVELVPMSAFPAPCGACGAVFYTGGMLGGGEYPLTHDLRVVEAIAVARGPIQPGLGCPHPSRVTVLRRLPSGQQIPIRVDLNEALRDPRENIPIWCGDMILLQETCCEKTCRWFGCVFKCCK
ncbi:MAG: hypothetical protein L0241_12950 [Planctomycetia bacterium]|nr:hypothetical protein [Planctomycetia bacterium]